MIDILKEAWLYFWGIFWLVWAFAGIAGTILVAYLSLTWNIRHRNH